MTTAIVLSGVGVGIMALQNSEEITKGVKAVIAPCRSQWNLLSLLPIPRGVALFVKTSHMVAFAGRSLCHVRRQMEHPVLSVGGIVVNELVGGKTVVQITARVVAITRIVLETTKVVEELSLDTSRLRYASYFIGVATSAYLSCVESEKKTTTPWIIQRLSFFSERLAEVVKKIVRLNILFFELYDTINPGPHTKAAVVDNLFIELREIGCLLTSSDQKVVDLVAKNSSLIDSIFSTISLPWRAKEIVLFIEKVEQKTGPLRELARGTRDVVYGALREISAQFVYREIEGNSAYEAALGAPRSTETG